MSVLMKCGHVAQGKDESGKPVCVICIRFNPGATEPAPVKPPLNDRISRCVYCGKETPSSWGLPFFEYRPTFKHDYHYCGCYGWD